MLLLRGCDTTVMKTTRVLLGSLLFIAANGNHDSGAKHQERNNRMVPDFQPFQHPSKKIESSGLLSSKSGPISDVEWVEQVVPAFGKLNTAPKQEKDGQGSTVTLLFGLILGGFIAGAFFKNKSESGPKEKQKTDKTKENLGHERLETKCKPVQLAKVKTNEEVKGATKNNVEKKMPEVKHTTIETQLESTNTSAKLDKAIDNKKDVNKDVNGKAGVKLNEIRTEVKEVKVTTAPKVQVREWEVIKVNRVENGDGLLNNINNMAAEKDWQEAKVKASQVHLPSDNNNSDNKSNKRSLSQATTENFEDSEWITKIKTFKITKYPKLNNADICQHGTTQIAVDVLDMVDLQNAEEMKTTIKTATAEMNIEGANTSRLRITVVVDKNDEESLSKTMTIKEFMVSISNQIIEDAVNRVKVECSMENIKHLAETIRKYRPESAEIKKVKSL